MDDPKFSELPLEIVRYILLQGARSRDGMVFAARCMRLSTWIRQWIAPTLYHTVDIWTETQAASFAEALEQTRFGVSLRSLVRSLTIKTTAFAAYDTQHTKSRMHPLMEAGSFTPIGATSLSVMKILRILTDEQEPGLQEVCIPMALMATKRTPVLSIDLPRSVTITGIDGLVWSAYGWDNVTHVRLTSYNPNFHETKWFLRLPSLTHFAFAFYYEMPLGLRIAEEMTASPQLKCLVMVVYPPSNDPRGKLVARQNKEALLKLDEPNLVVWESNPKAIDRFEDVESNRFWKHVDEIVEKQRADQVS